MYLVEVHHSIWWVAVLVCSGLGVRTQYPAKSALNSPPGRVATHRSCKAQMWILWISHSKGWRCRFGEAIEAILRHIMPIMHDWNQQNFSEQSTMDVADCWVCSLLGSRLKIFPFAERYMLSTLFMVVNNESCQWCSETSSEKYLHGRTRHTDEYEMVWLLVT